MRNFNRDQTSSPCSIQVEEQDIKAFMTNFSRMGAMVNTQFVLSRKKYVLLLYQNEKNEIVRMLTYVVHCTKKESYFVSGLQFVGIQAR